MEIVEPNITWTEFQLARCKALFGNYDLDNDEPFQFFLEALRRADRPVTIKHDSLYTPGNGVYEVVYEDPEEMDIQSYYIALFTGNMVECTDFIVKNNLRLKGEENENS